jgi:hypothetical protein
MLLSALLALASSVSAWLMIDRQAHAASGVLR